VTTCPMSTCAFASSTRKWQRPRGLGAATENAGPLDRRTQRLVKLAIAIGGLAEGAVLSNVRRAIAAGATPDEVRHVALLAITTTGFPTAVASLGWIEESSPQPEPTTSLPTGALNRRPP
jgi:alkylhydroperoxidase/carboxymuconolactone decarboxylase family protein YurZ